MEFVVKDLMISVLPMRPTVIAAGLRGRDVGSCDAGCTTCTGMTTCPGGCTGGTPHPQDYYEAVVNPATLAVLKQQLREALAAVEAREKVVYESMRPRSLAEVEILQAHLEGALQELKETAHNLASGKSSEG